MATHIRFRTDASFFAEQKALGKEWDEHYGDRALWDATEAAKPGDAWRIRWYQKDGEGPIAGYAICCPKCSQVHRWCSASNCSPCPHQGIGSCWNWTGSAEDGTLTASPSLFASLGCGWHGWLQNGEMKE
jgi:hypothetical protein